MSHYGRRAIEPEPAGLVDGERGRGFTVEKTGDRPLRSDQGAVRVGHSAVEELDIEVGGDQRQAVAIERDGGRVGEEGGQ